MLQRDQFHDDSESPPRTRLPAAEAPTFAAAAARWGRALQPLALPTLGPASRLALAGLSAFAAAAAAFAHRPDLDWARQVRLVARDPTTRLVAGSAGPAALIEQPGPHEQRVEG